jgi:7-keto-8-aminopelargonate synthetase-like enzyme
MNHDDLRKALADLKGHRDALLAFTAVDGAASILSINNAIIIPDEGDHLIKLTDGRSEYIIDPERVAWIRVGAESPRITSH